MVGGEHPRKVFFLLKVNHPFARECMPVTQISIKEIPCTSFLHHND